MSVSDLVQKFYASDALMHHHLIAQFLHDDLEVFWHSTTGYLHLNKQDLVDYSLHLEKAYDSSRFDITHFLKDGDSVTVRYTHFVTTKENPNHELILAHFMAIWEVKDQKLYRAYIMSQL